ncbi:RNase P modulator RnpM [Salisediminibacterium beveridgei]|uniref:Putative nucleic-acid-binding protein / transcriptional terminator n=1 Tax=Salisediminibacterium beveridgei TaxID=632773 RepID=A0A1D7QVW3_9BACI|nr:YlxR family protein [Salisediminibacterium beveridgei]AOM83145.1 putative nucleic-acid-binding protein / transcriptional terminator [Salisediminibacterium beveridgei]
MTSKKKTPLRKCIVTQEMKPKKELIRVVRSPEGEIFVDPSSKKSGRGAYIANDRKVIEKARQSNLLARNLKAKVSDEVYDQLIHEHERSKLR